MKVEGEAAKQWRVVRLDTFENANRGELMMADDATGEVVYKDAAGEEKRLALGRHAIRILPLK